MNIRIIAASDGIDEFQLCWAGEESSGHPAEVRFGCSGEVLFTVAPLDQRFGIERRTKGH